MTTLSPIKKRSARRCLFGRPDPKRINEMLDTQLAAMKQKQNEKWGFDFDFLCPLPGSSCNFDYVAVGIGSVPEYYRPKVIETPSKCRPVQMESSPATSPEPHDSSMECSDQEMRPPKTKSPKKRRVSVQARLVDIYGHQKKFKFGGKAVEPVMPTSPGCVALPV